MESTRIFEVYKVLVELELISQLKVSAYKLSLMSKTEKCGQP